MKLLYCGTVCNSEKYNKMLEGAKIKPSAAPFVFENALTKGFSENGATVQVISFPVLSAFPNSKTIFVNKINAPLDCGIACTTIPTINITGLKQFFQSIFSKKMLKKWLKENEGEEKAVLIYSVYQPVAKNIISLCKKMNVPCFSIIPDLPRDMYSVHKVSALKKLFTDYYTKKTIKLQSSFDGYIYLSEYMKDVINPNVPYTVVEGVANLTSFQNIHPVENSPRAIMYAGVLNEKSGIKNLLKAFNSIKDDSLELWLFGTGDLNNYIKGETKKDNRIKFFGFKSREEILSYELGASLLVNPRDVKEEYTKYSFPSKTIEYMLSGTPLITTKILGIPEEYFGYVFPAEDNSPESLAAIIKSALNKSDDELKAFGERAKEFIKNNKNSKVQSHKILQFIKSEVEKRR